MNKSFIRYIAFAVIGIEGLLLLLASLVGIIYKEKEFLIYLLCGLFYFVLGAISYFHKPKKIAFYAKDGYVMVALSWIVLSVCGAVPIYLTGEIPSYIDALFEIVSGFTTTGSTIMNDVEILCHASIFWRLFTHWIGGMGILVFVLAILPLAGGYAINILKAESPGPNADRMVSSVSTTARYLYLIYGAITLIEMILLKISGLPFFDSLVLSFATAGTGGFGILNSSFGSYTSIQQIIATVFMLLFGVNFSIYYGILVGKAKEMLKSEELKMYVAIIIGAIVLISLNIIHYYTNIFEVLKHASFQVASIITTTGFSSTDFNEWPMFSKTILVTLMFIGAMAGSTGGGIKVSRIILLAKDVKNSVMTAINPRRVRVIKFESKRVDDETMTSVKSFLALYVGVFVVSLLIISLDDFSYQVNFTAVAATINNIGPGLDMIGPVGNFAAFSNLSKIILIFDMLAGRLELLPMIILFSPIFKLKLRRRN